jgi:hypothetical protein
MAWRIKKTQQGIIFDTFSYFDVNKLYKKLDPKVLGGQFASNNQLSTGTARTADESTYLREINLYIKKLNEYGTKKSVEIKQEVTHVLRNIENDNSTFTKLERFFKEKASVINDAFVHEEEKTQEQRVDLRSELNNFRLLNKLSKREAYYPSSYILHFAWIFVFIFLEALINAYFFGEASSLGLLGGVFIGFITSFFNVLLSTIAGFVLRYKNHVTYLKKFLGLGVFMVLLGAIFFIHFFIAHYREILSTNPEVQISSVLKPMFSHPFALHDMESLILVSIGLLITLFSILKGMNFDDEYPGYGKVYRRWKVRENEFLRSKKQARTLLRDLHSSTLKKSDSMMETLEKSKKELEVLDSDLDAFINTYRGYHLRAVEAARKILSDYRAGARFVYAENKGFEYHDRLIVGEGGLAKLNISMLLESKELIESHLHRVTAQRDEFYHHQQNFENELDKMKSEYLDDDNIEKILKKVKKNREVKL